MKNRAHLTSVQALRAFAALYVFVFHAAVPIATPWPAVNEEIRRIALLGWVGVDVFFVISGFVIAWSCVLSRPDSEGIREFAIERFFRVVPLYWFALILAGLALKKFFTRTDAATVIKSFAFYPQTVDAGPWLGYPVLAAGWTLNYEVFFYLVFGICLLIAKRWAVVLAPVVLLALVMVPQVGSGALSFSADSAATFNVAYVSLATNPIILEFALGCIAAILFKQLRGKLPARFAAALLIVSLVIFIYCILFLPIGRHSPVMVGLPSMALMLSLVLAEDAGVLRIPAWAAELGTISYSLYLFHPFVVKVAAGLSRSANDSLLIGLLSCVLQTAAVIWLARFMYRRIELPCIELARHLLKRRSAEQTMVSATAKVSAAL